MEERRERFFNGCLEASFLVGREVEYNDANDGNDCDTTCPACLSYLLSLLVNFLTGLAPVIGVVFEDNGGPTS
jgi:hypothetical protein